MRLRRDPLAPFDPQPLMKARDAATVTVRQARRRPAELHGARGLAERIRPVLASLADPAVGAPAEGSARERVSELLAAAGAVLDAAARAIRHGEPVRLPAPSLAVLKAPDQGDLLQGAPPRAARRLRRRCWTTCWRPPIPAPGGPPIPAPRCCGPRCPPWCRRW